MLIGSELNLIQNFLWLFVMTKTTLLVVTIVFAVIVSAMTQIEPAFATITTTYNNDKATFMTDTSAVNISGVYNTDYWTGSPIVLSDVTINSFGGIAVGTSSFPLGYPNGDWTSLMSGKDIAIQGPEHLDVAINTGTVSCFGFDFVEPTVINLGPGDDFINSKFDITLKDGVSAVGTYEFSPDNDVATFTGVCSDIPFDKVEIRERLDQGTATTHRENEFYGHFWASDELPSSCDVESSTINLIAGQHIDSGDVEITNDGDNLIITISTQDGWSLNESHVAIEASEEDIPQTKKGNPKPGKFEYSQSHDPNVTTFEYVIPVTGLPEDLTIAIHTVVQQIVNDEIVEETAWANGDRFVQKGNWGMYTSYGLQCLDN